MKKIIYFFIINLFCIQCSQNDALESTGQITLSTYDLPNLGTNYKYEAWLLVNGTYVSIGSFTINDTSEASSTLFTNINNNDLASASKIAVTVEYTGTNAKTSPSELVVLAGNIVNGTANLTTNDTQTIFKDNITANYILDTPTATSLESEGKAAGIWFTNSTYTSAGLVLPYTENDASVAVNLTYQTWLKTTNNSNETVYINLGTFTKADEADNLNNFAGSITYTPIYPGNDFISVLTGFDVNNPLDLLSSNSEILIKAYPADATTTTTVSTGSTPPSFTLFEGNLSTSNGTLTKNNAISAVFTVTN